MLPGIIRGLGDFYTDGRERMEIHISKTFAHELPNRDGHRIAVKLIIGGKAYESGIRSTQRNNYIWICPNMRTQHGRNITLARVLLDANFRKNEKVNLIVQGKEIRVSHS